MALHLLLWVHVIVVLAHYSQRDQWVDKDNNQPIEPFDYRLHEPLLHAPEGANEEPNEDDLSVDNNDTEPDIDQELIIDKTDDDYITADSDDTSITADGDDTSITADGDNIQQDETNPITDTNNKTRMKTFKWKPPC